MSLRIEDLLQKLTLPKRYFNNDFVIYEKFKDEAETFVSMLGQCDGKEFDVNGVAAIDGRMPDILDMAQKNIGSLLKAVEYYENDDHKAAQEAFDGLMDRMKDDVFISSIDDFVQLDFDGKTYWPSFRITRGSRYYRVRAAHYESSSISENADELFHLPLSKRANANNERFSIAGFPSLYLSTMLPLAWQESGYPQKYYYSEYQYEGGVEPENQLWFLSLYSPDEIYYWGRTVKYSNFNLWLEVIARYLKCYPLVLACSFVNQSGKVPYKQEYIVPQMLMQWVRRNNSLVQGISYFTCIDLSSQRNRWCAYNIAIPAAAPYDDKGYSNLLREKFCWTMPQFYTVPIVDKGRNQGDREIAYKFISDLSSAMRTQHFPSKLHGKMIEMLGVAGCFLNLLENGEAWSMELALHILNSIRSNCSLVRVQNIEEDLKELSKDAAHPLEELSGECADLYKRLFNKFIGNDKANESIEALIRKYIDFCWNDLHPHSNVEIVYSDEAEVIEPLRWLRENHILRWTRKIDTIENPVEFINGIAKKVAVDVQELFYEPVGNDDWLKANIGAIKMPVFIKHNSVSIYSPDGTASDEFVHIGFDKNILSTKLKLNK